MNKRISSLLIGIALVCFGLFIILNGRNKTETQTSDKANIVETTDSNEPEEAEQAGEGEYVNYTVDNFAKALPNKRILFFHASWCPDCRHFEGVINDSNIPAGLTILKTDYDSETELKKKYGITYQTTLVYVDETGKEIDSWHAFETPTLEDVANRINLN